MEKNAEEDAEPMKQYFFDISDILSYLKREKFYSGIQRATVMIIEQFRTSNLHDKIYLSFYQNETKDYHVISYDHLPPGTLGNAGKLRKFLNIHQPSGRSCYPPLNKYNGHPRKLWYHSLKFDLNSFFGNENYFRRRGSTSAEWKDLQTRRHKKKDRLIMSLFFDVAKTGDSLVLLDATWNFTSIVAIFQQVRNRGINVYSLIHDLIPVVAPEYTDGDLPSNFHDWLIDTSTYTSSYLANSRSTAEDLKLFLKTYDIERPIQVVALAQSGLPVTITNKNSQRTMSPVKVDIYPKLHQSMFINGQVRSVIRQPYVLCVGTMEVRKNIWKIAQVWDRLRKVGHVDLPRLVFAGKVGWLTQDFDNFMKSTGNLYGWIDIFDKPTDDELSFLYRNCLFTITASFYEGWGLPIGEGLSYGKTAVVSETSSMPEVGGDLVEYCNPMSIDSILNACLKLIENPTYREHLERKIEQTQLRSWKDVAQDLFFAIASDGEIQDVMESNKQNNDGRLTESSKPLNVFRLKVLQ